MIKQTFDVEHYWKVGSTTCASYLYLNLYFVGLLALTFLEIIYDKAEV